MHALGSRTALVALVALVALTVVTLTACYSMHYVDIQAEPSSEGVERWNHFGLGGLVGDPQIELYEICPEGVARVEVWHSAANVIVSILLLGLYTPSTTKVWCAVRPSPEPTPEEAAQARPGPDRPSARAP